MYRMRDIVNHLIVAQSETVHHVDYKETESSISFKVNSIVKTLSHNFKCAALF